ncbi:hypothetical protein BKA56DRAFT_621703 [Ilyonectria sp. MPI-CAGE-AT-0026]|nr:hypothetical protein BKA56DRAFT_621703 [Ilyonectria sp. MPI-CAGE-AT-0026]
MGAVDYDDSPDGGERQQAERRAEAGRAARRSAQGHAAHGAQWVTGRTGDTGWTGWTGWGAGGCQQNTQRLLAGWLSRRVLPATDLRPIAMDQHHHGQSLGDDWLLPSDPCLSYIAQRHHAAIPAGLVDAPRRFSTPLDAPLDPHGVGVDALDVLGRPQEGEP